MTTKEQLKKCFATGKTPTGTEFSELIDSYFHRCDVVPLENIDGYAEYNARINEMSKKVAAYDLELNANALLSVSFGALDTLAVVVDDAGTVRYKNYKGVVFGGQYNGEDVSGLFMHNSRQAGDVHQVVFDSGKIYYRAGTTTYTDSSDAATYSANWDGWNVMDVATWQTDLNRNTDAITAETSRAETAEQNITDDIATEKTRATGVESTLATAIQNESTARSAAISALDPRLMRGTLFYKIATNKLYTQNNTDAENEYRLGGRNSYWGLYLVKGDIVGIAAQGDAVLVVYSFTGDVYKMRYENEEWNLETRYTPVTTTEKTVWGNKVSPAELQATIIEEQGVRATNDNVIATAVTSEESRAKKVEQKNATAIATEKTRAEAAEQNITDDIATEKTRATGVESTLATAIQNESTARSLAITTEKTRAETAERNLAAKDLSNTSYFRLLEQLNSRVGTTDSLSVTTPGAYVYYTAAEYCGLLLVSYRNGRPDTQTLFTANGVKYRRWDYSLNNIGGDWSPIWITRIDFSNPGGGGTGSASGVEASVTGDEEDALTLDITRSAVVMDDTTLVFTSYATIYNDKLIIS